MSAYKTMIALLAAAALIALGNFTTVPGFWFDEGIIAGVSRSLAEHGVYGTLVAPGQFHTNNFWITTSYPVTVPIALALKLFGIGIWQARLVPFLYLLLCIGTSYALIRRLYGPREALWSGLLLISFAPLYGNGKAVLGEVPGLFWLVFALWQYVRFADTKRFHWMITASLAAGLAISTKPFYVLLAPGFLYLCIMSWRTKLVTFKQTGIATVAFLAPLLVWFLVTIGQSLFTDPQATLSYFFNSYAADDFSSSIATNLLRFVRESTPVHFAFVSLVIIAAVWKKRKEEIGPAAVATHSLLIFGAIAWLWYLKTPGWYRYFFSIHVLALVFFPAAARLLLGRKAAVLLAALVLFQGIHLAKNYNAFRSSEAMEVANYLREQAAMDTSIFVSSRPDIVFLLPHTNVRQQIFVNKRLSIGLPPFPPKAPEEYVVIGDNDHEFFGSYAEVIDSVYDLEKEIGHTRIYHRKSL